DGIPPGAARASIEEYRPRHRQQRGGSPMVAVFLLHRRREPGIRSQASRRGETGVARDLEGGEPLLAGTCESGSTDRRPRLPIRVRVPDNEGDSVRPLARVRPRGHRALLRPAPPRSGDDQVHAAEDHRPGHRLAVSERAEEGVEGMITRRAFVHGLAAVGTVGFGIARPEGARAEPPPETTRLRLVRIPSICQAPQYVAEALLNAEGFTDVQYVQKAGTLGIAEALASGEANINNHFVARAIRDLKGKTVAVLGLGEAEHVFVSSMLAHV